MRAVLWAALASARLFSAACAGCATGEGVGMCITGMAYKRVAAATAAECCTECGADQPACAAWDYQASRSPSCALKNVTKVPKAGNCTSGSYSPVPPAPGPPSPPAGGGPQFSMLFHGGAVLQRGVPAAVWGAGAAGAVTLSLDGAAVATAAPGAGGGWSAALPAQPAGAGRTLTATDAAGSSSVTVSFGVVVLCSGQSNMGMPVCNKPGGFQADNCTAEAAAAGRYTDGISLLKSNQNEATVQKPWTAASPDTIGAHGSFSAMCWYSGRDLYDAMGGAVPVGLIQGAVGGSPIEFWLSPEAIAQCEVDSPQCDTSGGKNDSIFYEKIITPLFPYTVGALVWDQAERDVKCPVSLAAYPCLERTLASSWRAAFNSSFAFVVVQLPGYTAELKNGTGSYPGGITSEMVFDMRLAQAAGVAGDAAAAVVPTYDLSCQAGVDHGCPFGSVHTPHKAPQGERVGRHLRRVLLGDDGVVADGPRAESAAAAARAGGGWTVTVSFSGGAAPFYTAGTRNCTTCCDGAHSLDFDASSDGAVWVNGTAAAVSGTTATFAAALPAAPTRVRYTAASIWPQCALYNQEGLPAAPFSLPVR